ncbi:MAG TPA: hypothetical protein DEA08_36860 [Planctomycetes bacterium]|nr:hypothetical protein [Planctomycetota bacterium]
MGELDPIAKTLLREAPADFARLALGRDVRIRAVQSVAGDLQTLKRRADRLLRIELEGEAEPYWVHYEVQASWKADVPRRVFDYWSLISRQFQRTKSVVLCLQQGNKQGTPRDHYEVSVLGRRVLRFDFEVLCAWRDLDANQILEEGVIGLIPLLPFCAGCREESVERGLRALARVVSEGRKRELRIALAASANRVFPDGNWLAKITKEELMESTTWRDLMAEATEKAKAEGELAGWRSALTSQIAERLPAEGLSIVPLLELADPESLRQAARLVAQLRSDAELVAALREVLGKPQAEHPPS